MRRAVTRGLVPGGAGNLIGAASPAGGWRAYRFLRTALSGVLGRDASATQGARGAGAVHVDVQAPAVAPETGMNAEERTRSAQGVGGHYAATIHVIGELEDAGGGSCSAICGYVQVSGPFEPGDVLVVNSENRDRMRVGQAGSDSPVLAVVCGEAVEDGTIAPVVFSGVVVCKVDARYGAIKSGDLLSVSPTKGHGMVFKGDARERILGKALQPLPSGTGQIKILLDLGGF